MSVEDWISDDSIQQEIDEQMLYDEEMKKLNIKTQSDLPENNDLAQKTMLSEDWSEKKNMVKLLNSGMYTEKQNLNRSINLMMSKQNLKSKILKHGRMLDEEIDKVQKQQIQREEQLKQRIRNRDKQEYDVDIGMSGTTCTLIILLDGIMYYGFVGDSMACMSKVLTATSDQNTLNNDLIVTKPLHIPTNISEKMRIYSKKGEVRGGNWNQE